ncbi:peroxisomal 2,4-dienoyl-CoA reductase [(3E)-enoyl-CoA-producing] isoform X5 [Taeniopygia guttata]|uniref:peroxisomal 2,4-dienoyl-CoA reductase [(3E)-enoyl-CoA-producing] isoform X5 n=1 Tax=Taeniopygia guttata TaxID=59729 RepID=UPI003BB84F74
MRSEQRPPRHGRGRHGRAAGRGRGRGRGRVSAPVPAPALPRPARGPSGLHHRRRLRHRLPHRRDLHEARLPHRHCLQEFKRIDILINGAAGNFLCPASALSFNAFKTVIDIDTMGTFNTSKVLFEKYFRDHGGIIVNITATLSYRGQALQVHAGAAKAAIEGAAGMAVLPVSHCCCNPSPEAMTRHLAVEWGPNKIRVNSLAPGPISGTEGFRRLGGKFAEQSKQFSAIPLQRAGNKTEIAHSALYLASPLSSYVTGTTLVVDGGSWLTSPNSFSALLDVWAAGANQPH